MFLLDAKESLSIRPQTVEEIGEVNKKHAKLSQKKPEVCALWKQRTVNHLLQSGSQV